MKIRIIALIMATVLFISCFSGCNYKVETEKNMSEYYSQLKYSEDILYSDTGKFKVNLNSNFSVFEDKIENKDVRILSSVLNDDLVQIDSDKGISLTDDEVINTEIIPDKITINTDTSVTIEFTDSDFTKRNPDAYTFIFDNLCNNEKKYLYATVPVEYSSATLISDKNNITLSESPIKLNLTLDKFTFSEKISSSDLMLSGAFTDYKVLSVNRVAENTISLEIEAGEKSKGKHGYITVNKRMINNCSVDVTSEIHVMSPSVIVESEEFQVLSNYASINISLNDCTFSETISSENVSCDNSAIEISRVNKISSTEAVIYLSLNNETVEQSIEMIEKSIFTIDSSALNINKLLSFAVRPKHPKVTAEIIELKENGSDFIVSAEFKVLNGTFNTVSRSSFVFGGDYSKAEVDSIQLEGNRALIDFSMPKTSSLENANLYGTVSLKSGSVSGKWGDTYIPSFPLCYDAQEAVLDISGMNIEYDVCVSAINALSDYTLQSKLNSFDEVGKLIDVDKSAVYTIKNNYKYFSNLRDKLKSDINNEKLSDASMKIIESKAELETFIRDVSVLDSTLKYIYDDLFTLKELEEQIQLCKNEQEKAELFDEYSSTVSLLRSRYNAKISGESFSTILNRVIDNYISENGALYTYDYIIDCSYNWAKQTIYDKTVFRYYVTAVIFNSSLFSLYVIGSEPDFSLDNTSYVSLVHHLAELSRFILNDVKYEYADESGTVYCNTLGRAYSLEIFDKSDNLSGITANQITQLVGMLPKDKTLNDELVELGFIYSDLRYIICADDSISRELTFESSDSDNIIYTYKEKATVYDLLRGDFISDFEIISYNISLDIDINNQPMIEISVTKNLKIHSLG